MRIHPRLACLIYMLIVFPLFALFRKIIKWNNTVDIIIVIVIAIIGGSIYSYLVKKYDDEDMII